MRSLRHILPALLALFLASRGWADTSTEALKAEATRLFRAGNFERACPLFAQVVAASKFDAWGWNDLALCRVRSLAFDQVLEPLDKAAALEKVVGDEPLKQAIATNEGLLGKALLAHPKATGAGLAAGMLGVRRFDANDLTTACPLLALAAARGEGEVVFDADEWRRIGACRLEARAPAVEVLEALRRARAGNAKVEDLVDALSEREEAARRSSDADWKKHCLPLDGKACGRKWLLCTQTDTAQEPYLTTSTQHLVVIEAATLGKWKKLTPFEVAGERELSSTRSNEYIRCGAPPDMPGMNAVGSGLTEHLVLSVDACAATAVRWDLSDLCGSDGGAFSDQPVEVVPPPK
jgi:hypothetical protein